MSRRRARQRCTRQSETCHNEHAQRWANPAATASSTLFRTASLTSAGTRAGTGPLSPNRIFPRTTASSMACALTASVNCAISARAASSCQSRCAPGRPDLRAKADNAASLTVRRIPITVDTSTRHLRAASAWLISPAVTCRKISHFVSADRFVGRRRALSDSGINNSSRITRED